MAMNEKEEHHTHLVWFSYNATDEDGETCDFEGSIYASLDDEMIEICDDETEEVRYGRIQSSQFEWDGYVSNIVDCATLDSCYEDIEMENITYDGYEEIDEHSREYKEVA